MRTLALVIALLLPVTIGCLSGANGPAATALDVPQAVRFDGILGRGVLDPVPYDEVARILPPGWEPVPFQGDPGHGHAHLDLFLFTYDNGTVDGQAIGPGAVAQWMTRARPLGSAPEVVTGEIRWFVHRTVVTDPLVHEAVAAWGVGEVEQGRVHLDPVQDPLAIGKVGLVWGADIQIDVLMTEQEVLGVGSTRAAAWLVGWDDEGPTGAAQVDIRGIAAYMGAGVYQWQGEMPTVDSDPPREGLGVGWHGSITWRSANVSDLLARQAS